MNVVKWSALAIADLEDIDDYWMRYSESSAERIISQIERAGDFLTTMPRAGPMLRRSEGRKWKVAATPYLLIYRILDDSIEILRVHHGSQNWTSE